MESWKMGVCAASPLTHVWSGGAFHFLKPQVSSSVIGRQYLLFHSFGEDWRLYGTHAP